MQSEITDRPSGTFRKQIDMSTPEEKDPLLTPTVCMIVRTLNNSSTTHSRTASSTCQTLYESNLKVTAITHSRAVSHHDSNLNVPPTNHARAASNSSQSRNEPVPSHSRVASSNSHSLLASNLPSHSRTCSSSVGSAKQLEEAQAPSTGKYQLVSALASMCRIAEIGYALALLIYFAYDYTHTHFFHSFAWLAIAAMTTAEKGLFGLRLVYGQEKVSEWSSLASDCSVALFWAVFAFSLDINQDRCGIDSFLDQHTSPTGHTHCSYSQIANLAYVAKHVGATSLAIGIACFASRVFAKIQPVDEKIGEPAEKQSETESNDQKVYKFAQSLVAHLQVLSGVAGLVHIANIDHELAVFYHNQFTVSHYILGPAVVVATVFALKPPQNQGFLFIRKILEMVVLIFWMSIVASFDDYLVTNHGEPGTTRLTFFSVAMSNVALYYSSVLWFDEE